MAEGVPGHEGLLNEQAFGQPLYPHSQPVQYVPCRVKHDVELALELVPLGHDAHADAPAFAE